MKIRMKVEMSGTRNGQPWPVRGEVADLPTAEAAHLVASGIADEVVEPEPVETAVAPSAETTTAPAPETVAVPESEKRRGRPRKPRDTQGNIVRE
jgi:hypothetical protein